MKSFHSKLLILAVLALPPASLPSAAWAQRDTAYLDQVNQLQQSITLLTGQIEQLQYQNQQLQQQMEKMRADYDFRIEQLEKGGRGGGPRPGGPAPGPSAGAQPVLAPPGSAAAPAGSGPPPPPELPR